MKLRFNISSAMKSIRSKKFSVLIVPEGNKPVFSLKLRYSMIIGVLTAAVLVLLTILLLLIMNRSHSNQIYHLKSELSSSASTVQDKEEAIDQLHQQLVDLSEKSKTIENKMEQLEQLEAELKSITNTTDNSLPVGNHSTSIKMSYDNNSAAEGIGGESYPLSEEDILSLVDETNESITTSLSEIPSLQYKLEETKAFVEQYKKMMRTLPSYWPTDSVRVTSTFGRRQDPFNRVISLHNGLDIGGQVGDPVYAAADGVVIDEGYTSARGNYVTLSHSSGFTTEYMHLSKVSVSKGDELKQGDHLGALGSTGRSTGPHLHFEIIYNGVAVDPEAYLMMPREDE